MTVARTVGEAREWVADGRRHGRRVGFVPTLGALHAGHQSLVAACRRQAGSVALSIFLNPTQFAAGEDLQRYPRDPERDLSLAAEAGADMVFVPEQAEMYPGAGEVRVDVGRLGQVLEGAVRPAHFRGVATVVCKLLHALAPDVAVFGQKDAQQVLVVRRLVSELLMPVEIVCAPTVRAPDGLPLSSRNVYLGVAERAAAARVAQAAAVGRACVERGERRGAAVEQAMREAIAREPLLRLDYAAAVSVPDLRPLAELGGRILLLLAARSGDTRILDNACLEVGPAGVLPALP